MAETTLIEICGTSAFGLIEFGLLTPLIIQPNTADPSKLVWLVSMDSIHESPRHIPSDEDLAKFQIWSITPVSFNKLRSKVGTKSCRISYRKLIVNNIRKAVFTDDHQWWWIISGETESDGWIGSDTTASAPNREGKWETEQRTQQEPTDDQPRWCGFKWSRNLGAIDYWFRCFMLDWHLPNEPRNWLRWHAHSLSLSFSGNAVM